MKRPTKARRSERTGQIICICGRGYGSDFDGLCIFCRGGITAWQARRKKLSMEVNEQFRIK